MARKHTSGLILVFLAPWVLAGAAFGQKEYKEPPPRPAPQPIPPAPTGSPSPPRDDSIPGLEDADVRLSPAPMRREGSFIMRQRGSLVKLPGGEKAFIFHKDASGQAERPMVLLPCLALQSMEQIAGERSEQTVFLITGQVYAYYNVNYLLPTASLVAGIAEPAPKPTTPDPKATAPAPSTLKDPSVQDLIRELETQHDRPRTLSSAPAQSLHSTRAPATALIWRFVPAARPAPSAHRKCASKKHALPRTFSAPRLNSLSSTATLIWKSSRHMSFGSRRFFVASDLKSFSLPVPNSTSIRIMPSSDKWCATQHVWRATAAS